MPVTGGFFDGPEWGTQPYTNMFAADVGSLDPKYPVNTGIGTFLKAHGGTVVCSYGYGISPSSTRSAVGTVDSFEHAGGKEGELDTSIPFGSVAMTTPALVAKQKGCNAFYAGLDDNSNFALAEALKQAGVKPKVMVFPTGFEPGLVGSTAWSAVQGGYFDTEFRPFQLPNAGTQQMQAALEKYEHFTPSEFPNFSQYESWLGADLMIKGLQLAGKNPTQAGRDPRAAQPQELQRQRAAAGDDQLLDRLRARPAQVCGWYMIAEKNGFVPPRASPVLRHGHPGHHDRPVLTGAATSGGAARVRRARRLALSPRWRWRSSGRSARPSDLVAQLLGRVLVEHVEEVVVAHLEDLGGDAHAERVALAQVEIDDDTHQRSLSSWRSSAAPMLASASGRRTHDAPSRPVEQVLRRTRPSPSWPVDMPS